MPFKDGNTLLRCVISKQDLAALTSLHPSGKPSRCLKELLHNAAERNESLARKTVIKDRALKKKLREHLLTMADMVNELGEDE